MKRALLLSSVIWAVAVYLELTFRHPLNWIVFLVQTFAWALLITVVLALLFWFAVKLEAGYHHLAHLRRQRVRRHRHGGMLGQERLP